MINPADFTIVQAAKALKNRDFSAAELADGFLHIIGSRNPEINAYLEVFGDVAEQAKRADERIAAGQGTHLTGIPLAVKDNILIKGRKVSAASKILENYRATYDATAVERLSREGAVYLGRTNLDEFAMGGSTENSAFGVTKNPHDTSRVAGGSSGGSAAAVAMNGALAALGSDTGGSVRQPAGFCGVVGLKPTYGRVSRHGLMAMGSSLDQIGPITKSVEDAEIIFKAIAGKDPLDSTSREPVGNMPKMKKRLGVPRDFLSGPGIDKDVLQHFDKALKRFEGLGYEVVDVSLPNISYSLPVYYILMPAEVSSNLARFDGVKYGLHKEGANLLEDYLETRREGFGKEVRRRILLGTYVLSHGYYDAYYNKAQTVRGLIKKDFEAVFEHVDAVLTPTSPTPAFKVGEKVSDPLSMYLADIFTVSANIAGIPAISLPSGTVVRDGKNLPVGIQAAAPWMREDILFACGKDFMGEV